MLRIALLLAMSLLITTPQITSASEEDTLQSLETAVANYYKAWNERDLETILAFESTSAGFGVGMAFPREVLPNKEFYHMMLQKYFGLMEIANFKPMHLKYRVVGDTGLVWGNEERTTKQKGGPVRITALRNTMTFVKSGDAWTIALYHRSALPSEHIY